MIVSISLSRDVTPQINQWVSFLQSLPPTYQKSNVVVFVGTKSDNSTPQSRKEFQNKLEELKLQGFVTSSSSMSDSVWELKNFIVNKAKQMSTELKVPMFFRNQQKLSNFFMTSSDSWEALEYFPSSKITASTIFHFLHSIGDVILDSKSGLNLLLFNDY